MHPHLVLYTHKTLPCDTDPADITPAIIVKKHIDKTVNLVVFTSGGQFYVFNAKHGQPGEKGTWH